jgi:hypothetical protein
MDVASEKMAQIDVWLNEAKESEREGVKISKKEKREKETLARRLRKVLKESKLDMIDVKNMLGKTIYFNKIEPNSTADEWWNFTTYEDPSMVKVLIRECHGGFNSNKGMIQYDMDCLIKKCNFTEEEMEILKHFRAGQTQDVIAKELSKSQQLVSSKIDTMCNRISKIHCEDHYDNLRLNVIKGKYKRCSVCNEIKFEKDFYGRNMVCKPCYNSQK